MNVYLIRHAPAEPTTHLKKDKIRELTDEGKKLLQESCAIWINYIDGFDVILSSPIKRAIDTAEIISDFYNYQEEIIIDNSLAPGSTVNAIIQLAESLKGDKLAFIGHQPDIGNQTSSLISNSEVNLKIPSASIINIFFDGNPKIGKGILKFFLPPVYINSTISNTKNLL